jgi:sugar lactone lactonase YvrE
VNGSHDWHYVLDLKSNNLTKVQTTPPTHNIHGCVYRDGKLHVVTDGGPNESAYLATIDPTTWERTTILNNYYERPFMSFNDLEIDNEGNYYLTDSKSGWVSCWFRKPLFKVQRHSTRAFTDDVHRAAI